jgi:hypothetical protein
MFAPRILNVQPTIAREFFCFKLCQSHVAIICMAGWVLRAQNAILEAAEVVLDWLWFTVASSSASFASVNPLLLQYNTGTERKKTLSSCA